MDRGYQDSSTWNAFQAEFDTTPPLTREIRTGSIRRGAKTRRGDEWNRTIFAYRPARWFATRQTIVREAFLLSGGARMEEGGGK